MGNVWQRQCGTPDILSQRPFPEEADLAQAFFPGAQLAQPEHGMASQHSTSVQSSSVPPPPELAPELRDLIARNRQVALERRRAKSVREVQSYPVSHVQSDSQDGEQRVGPLLLASNSTTSHRRKFAFGSVAAHAARHHFASMRR